jgi:hypothetical protein
MVDFQKDRTSCKKIVRVMKYLINSIARSSYISLYTELFIIVMKERKFLCTAYNTNASVVRKLRKKHAEETRTPVEQPLTGHCYRGIYFLLTGQIDLLR